jgi:hypothetical protein
VFMGISRFSLIRAAIRAIIVIIVIVSIILENHFFTFLPCIYDIRRSHFRAVLHKEFERRADVV